MQAAAAAWRPPPPRCRGCRRCTRRRSAFLARAAGLAAALTAAAHRPASARPAPATASATARRARCVVHAVRCWGPPSYRAVPGCLELIVRGIWVLYSALDGWNRRNLLLLPLWCCSASSFHARFYPAEAWICAICPCTLCRASLLVPVAEKLVVSRHCKSASLALGSAATFCCCLLHPCMQTMDTPMTAPVSWDAVVSQGSSSGSLPRAGQ